MRSSRDRVRQAISFEIIGFLLSVPLAAFVFHFPLKETGVLGLIGATLATVWNYVFNLGFDHSLKWLTGSTYKSLKIRFIHAFSFELGIMIAFLPIIAWWMEIGLAEALIVDIAFVVFYLVYAFIFTWCYDVIFPDDDARETGISEPKQS
ncbi:MAG TPA: PACE efflux transporter [Marinobacter sp.]|nr:PACE efflux transporter [Marinobacter sp.]